VKFLNRLSDFILFGNILVAIGAACLVQSTVIQLQSQNHFLSYTLLVFFATLFIYNFQRVFYKPKLDKQLHSVRRQWIFNNVGKVKLLVLIGCIGVAISFYFTDFKIIYYLSPLLFLSIAYFAPFIKLRKNPWIKLGTLVMVWTMVTALVPILLIDTAHLYAKESILHMGIRFCFMAAICIPFDIRDLQIDKTEKITTIPHVIGEQKTKWLAVIFMMIYNVLIIWEYNLHRANLIIFIVLLLSAIINTVLVFMSSSMRNEYFYVAGIDGTMVIQGGLLMLVYYI
jgi:4-hydroxybenzoate polyprenyltransferase